MKVLVIGASGHVGNAIVRLLLKRKHKVTACGRRRIRPTNLIGLPVRYLSGDVELTEQLDRWVAGHDLVVDAAAPYPVETSSPANRNGDDPIRHAEVRTRRLLDAVWKHNARLAYVGSCVTVARPQTATQKFQAKLMRIAHPYFYVKELMENNILDACRRGLPAVLLDPAYCLGPWDVREPKYCTIPMLLKGEIPSSIDQVLHVVDVRDVAEALLCALDDERYGEPILLSAYRMSTHHLYSYICEIGGVPAPRYSLPTDIVLLGSYGLETALSVAGIETPLSSGAIMISTAFDYLEGGKELEELGITPRPLSETIT
ncbi:MAG: NAD-dependent epimerase/dehydratase family protein, partial [Candidatus Binatus sp.]